MWQLPPLKVEEILLYSRKSRTDDPMMSVEEVLSKHEQLLDEWVDRNLPGLGKIPAENRFREVVSGETIESRPHVQELLRRIESPRIKAVLIVEPQRLSRGDLEDIGRIVKLLRYTNTLVITLQYSYDLRDERDRDLFERELKRGNEFLEYTKRIMLRGRILSMEQYGNYIGNYPPYGYKKVMYKDGKRKCYTLEPVPEEAAVVKMIFEMYREGMGSYKIMRRLNSLGIPPARGEKWCTSSLLRIRENEHYLGRIVWNRRKGVKVVEDGQIISKSLRQDDYMVFEGRHPALIDQELWDAVHAIKSAPPVKGEVTLTNPYAGLVFCECGARMAHRRHMRKGVDESCPRLVCVQQYECGNASCTTKEFEKAIVSVLRDAIEDFKVKIDDSVGDQLERHKQLIEAQEKRLRELERKEVAQWDKYTQEAMPKHIFDQLNAAVLAEKDEVQRSLCNLRESIPKPVDYEKKCATFAEALETLQNPDVPAKEKNLLLKECFERIVYSRARKVGSRKTAPAEPFKLDIHFCL